MTKPRQFKTVEEAYDYLKARYPNTPKSREDLVAAIDEHGGFESLDEEFWDDLFFGWAKEIEHHEQPHS